MGLSPRLASGLALGIALAAAAAPERSGDPAPVRQRLAEDVVIDWTRLVVEVTTRARGHGVGATPKALEARALEAIGPQMAWAALRVPVAGGLTVDDLLGDDSLKDALPARAERWDVAEARYLTSGRVELVAELPLQELLKPWALLEAPLPPRPDVDTAFTGVVVDARGTGARPCYAPRLVHPHDGELWSGRLWDDTALFQAPVVWVTDPADPASARAGTNPLMVVAVETQGGDLVLGDDDRVRFRTGIQTSRVVGEGTVVVVIDP